MNKYAVWFGRVVWLGIIQDWVIGLPAIFAPNWLLELLGQRTSQDPVWTAFAGLLVFLLSLFYIPGAIDPYRYPANATLAALSRPPGVLFFFLLYPNVYPAFGIIDGVLCLLQIPLLILTMINQPKTTVKDEDVFEYDGSTFNYVKEAGFSEPYTELPYHQGLGLGTFLQFINDSARNLFDKRDIRPKFDKLIHANGICMTGIWRITAASPYTGYFAQGSQGLVFARFSVATPNTKSSGGRRTFGIAGKVFPTMNPNEKVKPGNFVTVDFLSGRKIDHVTDLEITNFPAVGAELGANLVNRGIFRLMDKRPGYRQLFPISTLGVPPESKVVTPDLLMIKVAEGTPKVDADDFREELRLANYPGRKLVYTVNVKNFGEDQWTRLGEIEFTEDAICEGCDKRTHFWIPRDLPTPTPRDEYVHPVEPN